MQDLGQKTAQQDKRGGLGDVLGPIGMTIGASAPERAVCVCVYGVWRLAVGLLKPVAPATVLFAECRVSPIVLCPSAQDEAQQRSDGEPGTHGERRCGCKCVGQCLWTRGKCVCVCGSQHWLCRTFHNTSTCTGGEPPRSIASMSTAEWRAAYERDGCVDLWMEEEFNSGSRLVGGRTVHNGGVYGWRSGEGPSAGEAATHTVKILNHYADQVIEVEVPEDR